MWVCLWVLSVCLCARICVPVCVVCVWGGVVLCASLSFVVGLLLLLTTDTPMLSTVSIYRTPPQVLPPGASKGAGVAALLTALGLDAQHMLAIGDAENDIEVCALLGASWLAKGRVVVVVVVVVVITVVVMVVLRPTFLSFYTLQPPPTPKYIYIHIYIYTLISKPHRCLSLPACPWPWATPPRTSKRWPSESIFECLSINMHGSSDDVSQRVLDGCVVNT